MSDKIIKALDHQFSHHRIIFWYDDGGKMEEIYQSYQVPGEGIKLEIDNNEFHIRYQLLKENPESPALVYSRKAKPANEENWLLDLNLAHFIFASDESAMILQELELRDTFLPLIRKYTEYFRNRKERLEPFKKIITAVKEDETSLKTTMMSVLTGQNKAERETRKSFPIIVLSVFLDCSEKGTLWESFVKYNLDEDFWVQVESHFGYSGIKEPDAFLNDTLTTLYKHQMGQDRDSFTPSLYAHFDNWRKHQDYVSRVQDLLDRKEKELNIAGELEKVKNIQDLLELDLYKETDKKIFTSIYTSLMNYSLDALQALQMIDRRRETYWYKSGTFERMENHYKLLYSYLLFHKKLQSFRADFSTLEEGWKEYSRDFYELDGEYRRVLEAFHKVNVQSSLIDLLELLEKEYTEGYLQPLADQWQKVLEKDQAMESLKPYRMTSFFKKYVKPYLEKNQALFVIISDGFRFEMGAELSVLLEQKNRFTVETGTLLTPVPSYTQLGMAALLPHKTLTIAEDGNKVLADGQSTAGMENRIRIVQSWLDQNMPGKQARAMNAKDFKDLSRGAQNDFIRGIDLVFLYSAGADAVGDNIKTEENLPNAAAVEIQKIADYSALIGGNLSRTHILVTADHGFLFRHKEVPDTERSRIDKDEQEVRRDHRFILSPNPLPHPAADILEQDQLEWEGPFKAQFARGVNRFRCPGGGTRYVHGGRMPQELCVPLLTIKKTRSDDVQQVHVAVLDRQTRITTGQTTVSFLQESPVGNKNLPRELEVVFEGPDGKIISNSKKLIFDSTDPIDQNRSRKESFNFTKESDRYNGKLITLKLYDIRSGDTHVLYREYTYTLQKKLQLEVDFG